MRARLLLFSLLLSAPAHAQIAEASIGYSLGLPGGSLSDYTGPLHSISVRAAGILPGTDGRLSAGIDFSSGSYASFSRKQLYPLLDGAYTVLPASYSSGVGTLCAGVRYEAVRVGPLALFAGIKGGITVFRSAFSVDDPNETETGQALESARLYRDRAPVGGAEAGVNVDLSSAIRSLAKERVLIQARVGMLRGGAVDYINVNHRENISAFAGSGSSVRLVSVGRGRGYEDEVAPVHTSSMNYVDCGISVVVRLD